MVKSTEPPAAPSTWPRPPARVRALAPGALPGQVAARLAECGYPAATANPFFRTLAVHEGAFSRWLPWHAELAGGDLDARSRELVILRTAWRCRARYAWDRHVRRARAAGLTDAEVAGVTRATGAGGWAPYDAALLDLVDGLHDTGAVGDATWSALARVLTDRQLVELVLLVGHYHQVAFFANAVGVPADGPH
jgi:alkylhydroperoxidase family enzyme